MRNLLPARLALVCCLLALLAACDAAGADPDPPRPQPAAPTERPAQGPREELPRPAADNAVGARIYEYAIEVTRDTVAAGEVAFHVVNAGTTEHWLIIRGGDEFHATPHLMPGESAVLRAALEAGEYRLVCTIRDEFDHISEGEQRTFVVR